MLLANLDPSLVRRAPAATAAEVLEGLAQSMHGAGITTQEVAAIMAVGNDVPDRIGAERALLELVCAGDARREPCGDDALWFVVRH